MKTLKFLLGVGLSLIALYSCNQNTDEKGGNVAGTTLSPQEKTVNGEFSSHFELVEKDFNYVVKMPTGKFGLPSFEMPIDFIVTDKYDYQSVTEMDKFDFNFDAYDNKGAIVKALSVNTEFEVVESFIVRGIDFKKILTSEVGDILTFNFKTFLKKEEVETINEAKYFKISIAKSSPENMLKNIASSFDRSSQISSIQLKNDVAIIDYKEQVKDEYWNTGKKIEKAMVGIPARIFKKLDFINSVNLTIPFDDVVYKSNISKQDLEKHTGLTIEEIRQDWNSTFSDVYIYKLNNPKREFYFNKFVDVTQK